MLRERLEALVAAAPEDATVTVRWVAELLAAEPIAPDVGAADLTVREVAARYGRGLSTIRTWLERGELHGASRLHGKEWRIPLASLEAMQCAAASKHAATSTPRAAPRSHVPDLGAWRKVRRA